MVMTSRQIQGKLIKTHKYLHELTTVPLRVAHLFEV
jgi:hypothetical protein